MATRPLKHSKNVELLPYVVKASNTIRHGMPVKLSSGEIVEAGAAIADDCIGIAYSIQVLPHGSTFQPATGWTAPAASTVNVALLGAGIVPVRVGTTTATAGSFAKMASDGAINGTIGGGSNKLVCLGQFVEAGVTGDLVGLNLAMAAPSVGS